MKRHECQHRGNVVAFVRGELPLPERGEFEAHIFKCTSCREEVESTRQIVEQLQATLALPLSGDLAPAVMARLNMAEGSRWRFWVALAAGLALLLGGAMWFYRPYGTKCPAVGQGEKELDPVGAATEWLCATQERDGSWSTARWGGRPQFEVALTGLSLMALLETRTHSERVQGAIKRAADYLIHQQDATGRLGSEFDGAPYNQGIATLALARTFQMHETEALRGVLDRALRYIARRQNKNGGWGYEQTADRDSNLSITIWQIEALRLAGVLGWNESEASADRGLKWMTSMVSGSGAFGYRNKDDFPAGAQTLTAMGAMSLIDGAHKDLLSPECSRAVRMQIRQMAAADSPDLDYYHRYFLAAALRKMGEESEAGTLASMRKELMARQVEAGDERGSWPADDRWSASGGRIYATALAALSLN